MGPSMDLKEMLKSEFMAVIEETQKLLKENYEWRDRYSRYAKEININLIKKVRRSFHEWSPLYVYLNISSAKNAKTSVSFELRYLGQTVAKLTGNINGERRLSTKDYEESNCNNFHCGISLSDNDWTGKEAAKFRKFFKDRKGSRIAGPNKRNNEEHRLQSLFLTEFSKKENKVIRHIKPVTIGGVRFPMPTKIRASNHKKIGYSKKYGGIDILARTGTGGPATRLCIMELKDDNNSGEPPKDALKQAVAYATFIRELVRSSSGKDWWKLFGFGGEIPESLELYAACVMPSNSNNDYSFRRMKQLRIDRDIIKLHYLYFTKGKNGKIKIKPGDTSLALN